MTIKSKYKLLKKFSHIFGLKVGDIFKAENGKCYKVAGWFSFIYKTYLFLMTTELSLLVIFGLYMLLDTIISIWWMNLITCALLYMLIEFIMVSIVPMKEVPCWEKSLQEKEEMNL